MSFENVFGICCNCGITVCGCTNVANPLHLTIPSTLAATLAGPTSYVMTYDPTLPTPQIYKSACFPLPGGLFGGGHYFWTNDCIGGTPLKWEIVFRQTTSPTCSPLILSAILFSTAAQVPTHCGPTFLMTFVQPMGGTFSGNYTETN
jgi:hypothetical protein